MKPLHRMSSAAILIVFTLSSSESLRFGISAGTAHAQDLESKKIVPFVPTPQDVVDKMIELAGVKQGDVVYDLGSGDGRIVITAAKKGARAIGFDVDGDLGAQRGALEAARQALGGPVGGLLDRPHRGGELQEGG